MEDWRKRAAAHADYSGPDPLLQMAQIHGLLFAVEALATWTLTLGLPQPMEMKKLLAGIQAVLEPAPSPLPA